MNTPNIRKLIFKSVTFLNNIYSGRKSKLVSQQVVIIICYNLIVNICVLKCDYHKNIILFMSEIVRLSDSIFYNLFLKKLKFAITYM